MAVRHLTLKEFLANQNLPGGLRLPWVHGTEAARLFDLIADQKILAAPCNVFKGEKLCYLFVGRPAYKTKAVEEPSAWQLPIAFVIRFASPPPIKRAFPFDSGAFTAGILPSYITTFKLDGYNVAGDESLLGRLVSFYFKTPQRYFDRTPAGLKEIEDEHSLDMSHAQILALARLYGDRSAPAFDDRAAAIEIQVEQDIELKADNLLGIVMPEEYARVPEFMADLKRLTKNIETYRHYPLGNSSHYALVYDGVQNIYKKSGIAI